MKKGYPLLAKLAAIAAIKAANAEICHYEQMDPETLGRYVSDSLRFASALVDEQITRNKRTTKAAHK